MCKPVFDKVVKRITIKDNLFDKFYLEITFVKKKKKTLSMKTSVGIFGL